MDSHDARAELVGRLSRRCGRYERELADRDERIRQLEQALAEKNGDG